MVEALSEMTRWFVALFHNSTAAVCLSWKEENAHRDRDSLSGTACHKLETSFGYNEVVLHKNHIEN